MNRHRHPPRPRARLAQAAGMGLFALGVLGAGCSQTIEAPAQGLAVIVRGPLVDSPFQDPNAAFLALIGEGPGIAEDKGPFTIEAFNKSQMQLQIPEVPYGPQRQILVEVYPADANGKPTYPAIGRGRTPPRDIESPAETFAVRAYVTRTHSWATPINDNGQETLIDARIGVGAAMLPDGNVLLAGGGSFKAGATKPFDIQSYGSLTDTVFRYDVDRRVLEVLSAAGTKLAVPRTQMATATGPDGQVVFAGGVVMGDLGPQATGIVEYLNSKEIEVKQSKGAVPHLKFARSGHTITRLFDTQQYYLIAGGIGPDLYQQPTVSIASNTWEIWDPVSGRITEGSLAKSRWNHATVRLPSKDGGYIVLIGGENYDGPIADFEVIRYDNRGNIAFQGNTKITCYCGNESITGEDSNSKCAALATQPNCSTYQWVPLLRAFEPAIGRTLPGAVFVSTGNTHHIWVVGGFADAAKTQPLSRVDVFDMNSGAWLPSVPALEAPRGGPVVGATLAGKERGRVVVTGGLDANGATVGLAEVLQYQTSGTVSGVQRENANGTAPGGGRVLGQAIGLRTGHVLLVGGATGDSKGFAATSPMGLYNPR